MNVITYREGMAIITALTDVEYAAAAHRATALAARGTAGDVPGATLAAGTWGREHVVRLLEHMLRGGPLIQAYGPPDSIGYRVSTAEGLGHCACTGEAFWAGEAGGWALTFLPDGSILLLGQGLIDAAAA